MRHIEVDEVYKMNTHHVPVRQIVEEIRKTREGVRTERGVLTSFFRCSSPPCNPVYVRRVDPSDSVFSLPSHRYLYIGLLFSSRFIV